MKQNSDEEIYFSPFVYSLSEICPHVSKEEITALILKLQKSFTEKDFFTFSVEREYLNLLNIDDEVTLKTIISEAFDYERFKDRNKVFTSAFLYYQIDPKPLPSYELINKLLKKISIENGVVLDIIKNDYYLFMKAFLHLVWKTLFRIANVIEIDTLLQWTAYNLDFLLVSCAGSINVNDSKARETITKCKIDLDLNIIAYDKKANLPDAHLYFGEIVTDLPKIFSEDKNEKLTNFNIEMVSRLIVEYICILIELSRTDTMSMRIRICSYCGELFLDSKDISSIGKEHDEKCMSCSNHLKNETKVTLYCKTKNLGRHFPKLHDRLKQTKTMVR